MVNVLVVKDHLRLAYDICNSARVKEVVDEFVVCACVCVCKFVLSCACFCRLMWWKCAVNMFSTMCVCVCLSVQKKKKGGRVLIDGGGSNVTMYNKKNSSMISVGPRFSKFHLYVHISRLMWSWCVCIEWKEVERFSFVYRLFLFCFVIKNNLQEQRKKVQMTSEGGSRLHPEWLA